MTTSDTWMTLMTGAGQLTVGLVFARSGFPKLTRMREFTEQVAGYEIVRGRAATLAGIGLVICEVASATALIVGSAPELSVVGMLLAGMACVVFLCATGLALHRRRKIACGCFGRDEVISGHTFARLVLLALLAGSMLLLWTQHPAALGLVGAMMNGQSIMGEALVILGAILLLLLGKLLLAFLDLASMSQLVRPPAGTSAVIERRKGE